MAVQFLDNGQGMTVRAQDIPLMASRQRHILVLRPMKISTDYLDSCIETLQGAFTLLQQHGPDDMAYRISRSACVKEFEIIEELCGALLKKQLRGYFASNREADRLYFRDIFRHAARHGLITGDECQRWLQYRDVRNNAAHRYGEAFADDVLAILPKFIDDASDLSRIISEEN